MDDFYECYPSKKEVGIILLISILTVPIWLPLWGAWWVWQKIKGN